ncbi:MAG: outer membrane beta-barrel protein [Chitinophagales bacterium]
MSKQNGHSIDDLFKRGLENHEVIPSFKTWDNIQYQLPVATPFYKKNTFIYGMLAGFAMLISLGSLSYYLSQNQTGEQQIQIVEQHINNTATSQDIANVDNDLLTKNAVNDIGEIAKKATVLADNQAITFDEKTKNDVGISEKANHFSAANANNSSIVESKNNSIFAENAVSKQRRNRRATRKNKVKNNYVSSPIRAEANADIFRTSGRKNKEVSTRQSDVLNAKNTDANINNAFIDAENNSDFSANLPTYLPFSGQNVAAFSSKNTNINLSQISKLPLLEALQIANEMILEAEASETSATIEKPIDFPIDPNVASITGLYFSTFAGINNTWILNSEAVDATVNGGKLNYLLDFGSTYGFATGYDFSPHWGLQIEWIVSSKQGQRYEHFEHGATKASTTDVNLVYTYFPVLAKFRMSKISKLTKQPIVLNYVGGVQYGVLKSAEIPVNNPIIHDDLYKKNSWGFVLGADYNMALSKHYAVSLGGRASISTTSNNANEFIFPNKKTSNNILLGARASLYYRFSR